MGCQPLSGPGQLRAWAQGLDNLSSNSTPRRTPSPWLLGEAPVAALDRAHPRSCAPPAPGPHPGSRCGQGVICPQPLTWRAQDFTTCVSCHPVTSSRCSSLPASRAAVSTKNKGAPPTAPPASVQATLRWDTNTCPRRMNVWAPKPCPGQNQSVRRLQGQPRSPRASPVTGLGPAYAGRLAALSRWDRTGWRAEPQPGPATSHLLAPTVEGRLHLPPGLGHVAFLQEGKIVRVLEGDFELLVVRLFQGVQEVLGEPSFGNETRSFKRAACSQGCRGGLGTGAGGSAWPAPALSDSGHPPPGPNPKGQTRGLSRLGDLLPSASELPRGQERWLPGPLDGVGLPGLRLLLCPLSVNGTMVDTTGPAAPTAPPLHSASAPSQQPPVLRRPPNWPRS